MVPEVGKIRTNITLFRLKFNQFLLFKRIKQVQNAANNWVKHLKQTISK